MGLPRTAVKRPVLIWVIFSAAILLGTITLVRLPIELYQGTGTGIVSIIVRARGGLAPIEVEQMITKPIEESVSTVSRLKNMYSHSKEAEGRVTLEFEPGTDMKFATLEVREKFSRVKSELPPEIEKPVIANYQESDSAILIVAVTSETLSPEEIRELIDQELKPRLDRLDGVASVEVYGGRERKILAELDRDKMFAYRISVERVMDAIGAANVNLLAGSFERGAYDFAVRTMGAFTSVDEIGEIGVKGTRQGSIIPLKEIATVKDAYLEPEDYARLNLDQNVSLYVKKTSFANTIRVSDELKRVIDAFASEHTADVNTVVISDKARLIKEAIADVRNALVVGAVLVALMVYAVLRRRSLALIVFTAMPISVISTFFVMGILGLSINVMTMSGLALSVGILIDSAVVVIENCAKKKEEGLSGREAVVRGAEEMWIPLLASLATSLCVFLPVVLIDPEIKLMYQGFVYTVCSALSVSLVVAVVLLPVLLSKVDWSREKEPSQSRAWNFTAGRTAEAVRKMAERLGFRKRAVSRPPARGGLRKVFQMDAGRPGGGYERWARAGFRHRYLLLGAVIACFLFSAWRLAVRHIDVPTQLQENEFEIIVFPLAGAKLDTNDEVARKLEELLNAYEGVEMISTTVQRDDLRIFVRLVPRTKRNISKEALIAEIEEKGNELIKEVHDEYDLIIDEGASSEEQKKLVINIFGLENDTLEELAHEVAKRIGETEGLSNLVMTDLRKRPEYSVVVDKGRASIYGFTVREIADSIHAMVRGMRPTKFHELKKGLEIETITRLQPIYRQKVEDLRGLYLVSPKDGTQIALKQIAGIYPSRGPQAIDRKDKYRYVFVKGDTSKALESVAEDVKSRISDLKMPRDYFWRFGGAYEDLIKGKSKLGAGVLISIGLIYMVLACLYQSYTQPLIIMIAIPLAAVGVWAALAFTRKPLSQQVFIGMFILVGYAVNSAIILVDRINHLRPLIRDREALLVQAARERLRPILVTTGSTVIGFIPLAFSAGESSELWSPLAITMIGGIVSSTVLNLFLIPNFYLYADDFRSCLKRFRLERLLTPRTLRGSF